MRLKVPNVGRLSISKFRIQILFSTGTEDLLKMQLFQPPSRLRFNASMLLILITRLHAGHCWKSKDELISDVLLWTPTYSPAKAGRPARTYIQQLCEGTGCSPEDLPEAMNDREKWRERVRDIRAGGTTWWWWWHVYRSGQNNGNTRKFKEVFWLQHSCESCFRASPLLHFFEDTGSLRWSLSSAVTYGAVFGVILPNNPRKSPSVSIRQVSLSSRVLLQWGSFPLLSQMLSITSRQYS